MHGDGQMLEVKQLELQQGSFRMTCDFRIEPESRVAVIGPSGAGKSTLLMALAGFLEPVQGAVVWSGSDITNSKPSERPFAVLFQDNNLFPHMNIEQNVGLGLRPSLRLTLEEKKRVCDALGAVGLADMGSRKPSEMSGGQQSRAALARVLLQDKAMILLDEPFAALGPALKIEMLDLVADLCAQTGAGLMMVSHAPNDAERLCDQAILVADSMAHPPVATSELLSNPPPALRAYLGT